MCYWMEWWWWLEAVLQKLFLDIQSFVRSLACLQNVFMRAAQVAMTNAHQITQIKFLLKLKSTHRTTYKQIFVLCRSITRKWIKEVSTTMLLNICFFFFVLSLVSLVISKGVDVILNNICFYNFKAILSRALRMKKLITIKCSEKRIVVS